MNTLRHSSPRPPRLRRKLAFGGAGLMALAVVLAVGYTYSASRNDQARAETRQQLAAEHAPGEVVVGYRSAVSDQTKQAHISRHAGRLKARNAKLNFDVIAVPVADEAASLQDLKTQPDVAYAEPNFKVHARAVAAPTDPSYSQQWGYANASFPAAWNTTTGAGAPLIGLVDSGVDMTHPDLAANVAPGGYDFINNDADPTDDFGHGTSTMGIIAEVTNNGIGGAGGCWTCKVMPIKVLDNTGGGSSSQVAQGYIYAADHGVKIISASLGGPGKSTVEENAVAYAISKGVVFISAVCEDDPSNTIDYPSAFPGVIGVGALSPTSTLETWSCYGPMVKLSAPSTTATTALNHAYSNSFQGTSASAPFVAAAAALIWAAHPTATSDQVRTALLTGSDACCSTTSGGKLDVGKAMTLLGTLVSTSTPTVTPTPTSTPTVTVTASPAPGNKGDLNADGKVDVFDLSYLLTKWATADAKADLNKDGTTNVFDLSLLLSSWAP